MTTCVMCSKVFGDDMSLLVKGYCRTCANKSLLPPKQQQQQQQQKQSKVAATPVSPIQTQSLELTKTTARDEPPSTLVLNPKLRRSMKPHQKEGFDFILKQCFADSSLWQTKNNHDKDIGGCILAHFMGLGKSLTTIAVLYTIMTQPCIVSDKGSKEVPVSSVLVIVPANTVSNWEDEVKKWTGTLDQRLPVYSLRKIDKSFRQEEIEKWNQEGGVLFLTDGLFLKFCKFIVRHAQPQVVVLDEAHTMLKHARNTTAKGLWQIETKRRILLTGTPLQNNVTEYYQLINYVRPGVIEDAKNEQDFDRVYRKVIEAGLASDAGRAMKEASKTQQLRLHKTCERFVHRVDAKCLRNDLPEFCDTLLYLQASNDQNKIMRKYSRACMDNNFFRKYQSLSPILNHPGILGLMGKIDWMGELQSPADLEKYNDTWRSPKFIILAHILAKAMELGEKTLVYSKCLRTLDLIETFLASRDWRKQIGSLKECFPEARELGNWKKNKDYLRIDGSTDSGKRGYLVNSFNSMDQIRVFLISSVAGGIGINLTSASRVVIMDNHFNPSVSSQCVARAHRYGQDKPVHCCRLAIFGTLESKVYNRAVNKTSVASGVIDGNHISQNYTKAELDDLLRVDCWATCDKCRKSRRLDPSQEPEDDLKDWYCEMNKDKQYNSCDKPQEIGSHESSNATEDPILNHLARVVNFRTKKTALVTGWVAVEQGSPDNNKKNSKGVSDVASTKKRIQNTQSNAKLAMKRSRGAFEV